MNSVGENEVFNVAINHIKVDGADLLFSPYIMSCPYADMMLTGIRPVNTWIDGSTVLEIELKLVTARPVRLTQTFLCGRGQRIVRDENLTLSHTKSISLKYTGIPQTQRTYWLFDELNFGFCELTDLETLALVGET